MAKQNYKTHNGIIAIFFVCLLVLAAFVAAACTNGFTTADPYGWFTKKTAEPEQAVAEADLEIVEVSSSSFIRLLAGGEAVTASEPTGVSKQLTAIVSPSEAPNKAVDWTLYWADDAALKNQPIGNYLTLATESDGATTATITCTQSFRGSYAYVKATTRVGGYEAVCRVSFVGEVGNIRLDTTGLTNVSGGNNGFQYEIPVTGQSIAINLENVFNDVDPSTYDNLVVELQGIGKIEVQNWNNIQGWTDSSSEITLESIKNQIVSVAISGHNLVITPIMMVENYYESYQSYGTQGARYTNKFKQYVGGSAGGSQVTPYWHVWIRNGVNVVGACEFSFRIVSTVSGVGMSSSDLTF